ncbi:MAG: hypothetical protein HQM12_01985 [SAR324 cluster bacterium]|nr:hypothetical protein [SAR324 cluster bacterium]MBF0352155.1 hypothetical protein [SAR324 cluster bacterium]
MVNLLKPEYEGKILFLMADITSQEGKWFAQYHEVPIITLMFFGPDGKRITTLQGVQTEDFLRRAFNRVFKISGS